MNEIETGVKTPLKSCPFCGALEEDLQIFDLAAVCDLDGHAVSCNVCGGIGPSDYSPAAARALWNGAALVSGVRDAAIRKVAA